jgi:hypothetical protein
MMLEWILMPHHADAARNRLRPPVCVQRSVKWVGRLDGHHVGTTPLDFAAFFVRKGQVGRERGREHSQALMLVSGKVTPDVSQIYMHQRL